MVEYSSICHFDCAGCRWHYSEVFICLFVCLLLRSESKRLQVKTSKSELGTWYNNEWTKNNNRNGGKRAMGRFIKCFRHASQCRVNARSWPFTVRAEWLQKARNVSCLSLILHRLVIPPWRHLLDVVAQLRPDPFVFPFLRLTKIAPQCASAESAIGCPLDEFWKKKLGK